MGFGVLGHFGGMLPKEASWKDELCESARSSIIHRKVWDSHSSKNGTRNSSSMKL